MSWSLFSGSVRTVASSSGSAARGFTDHLNRVLNTTLTESRLSLIEIPGERDLYLIKRVEGALDGPMELLGTGRTLFAQQVIRVVDGSDGDGHCQTVSYRYRLQADESPGSTLIRWEYDRNPPRPDYEYPSAASLRNPLRLGHSALEGENQTTFAYPLHFGH